MDFELIKKTVAESASQLGITEYEIYKSDVTSVSAETLGHEISSLSSSVKGGICFRCSVNGKMGYASTQLIEEEEIRDLVRRAAENAGSTETEDTVGIFGGSEEYGKPNAPEYKPLSAEEIKNIALDIQSKTYAASDKVADGTQSAVQTAQINVRIVNSHGLDLENSCGINFMYAMAVVNDKDESRDDFAIGEYGKISEKELAEKSVNGALEKIGAKLVPTGKYNIVIDAKQFRSLLAAFSGSFSAKEAQMGMSRLAGKEGEKIAADIVNITDDPMRAGVCAQTPFDAEGVATYRKDVVKNGVLKTLLYNRETAAKAGKQTTANASKGSYASPVGTSPYAFCIEAGEKSLSELFEMAGDGIYVTEVKGLHAGANGVTGDFSVESEGFLIKDGKKSEPVKSFTIAGNFFELLLSLSALGNDLDIGISGGTTVFGAPSALIENMSVAGE